MTPFTCTHSLILNWNTSGEELPQLFRHGSRKSSFRQNKPLNHNINSQGMWDHFCSLSSTAFLHFSFIVPLSSLVLSLPLRPPHGVLSPPANAPHLYLLPSAWAGHPDGKETFLVQGDWSDKETQRTESWGEASTLGWLLMCGSVVRPDGAACVISKAETQPRVSAPHWEEKTYCTTAWWCCLWLTGLDPMTLADPLSYLFLHCLSHILDIPRFAV